MNRDEILYLLEKDWEDFRIEVSARYPIIAGNANSDSRIEQVIKKWNDLRSNARKSIYQMICEEMRYCDAIHKESRLNLIYALAGCISVEFGAITVPAILMALIILKAGLLDQLCDCSRP